MGGIVRLLLGTLYRSRLAAAAGAAYFAFMAGRFTSPAEVEPTVMVIDDNPSPQEPDIADQSTPPGGGLVSARPADRWAAVL